MHLAVNKLSIRPIFGRMIVICDQSSPKSTVLQGIVIQNQKQSSIFDYFKK